MWHGRLAHADLTARARRPCHSHFYFFFFFGGFEGGGGFWSWFLFPPSTSFSKPPTNLGRVVTGSPTVLVNGRQLARVGDPVATCNDPADAPTSSITAGSPDVMVA